MLKVIIAVVCAALFTACAGDAESIISEAVYGTSDASQESPDLGNSAEAAGESAADTEDTSASSEAAVEPIKRDLDYEYDKVVALTFDDGPNTTTTMEVLEVLKKHGVVASFFLVGNNINDETAEVVKYAYDLGCEIDNHSKSHGYMNEMSREECEAEYKYVDDKVFEITGEHTKFFRPPYIAISDRMWDYIDAPFIAGVGCDDWNPRVDTQRRITYMKKKAQNGGLDGKIILLHDAQGNDQTVAAIDEIIPALKAEGYRFVTVSELFAEKGIEPAELILYTDVEQTGMWS